MDSREVLEEVVASVQRSVEQAAFATKNIRGHAVEMLGLRHFQCAADNRRVRHLDIGIEKKHIRSIGDGGSAIAPHGRHAARNHAELEPIAERQSNLGSAVSRVRVSDQHPRTRNLRVVLRRKREQQVRNQFRLVLRRNHDRQLARCIHGYAPPRFPQ